jgi:putative NADH-flavin reductase
MSTVLIIGASRGIGLETVKLALKAGHSVRAMARSANAIRLHDPRLEKLDGDALDQHTIERALVGVDAVIQTLGVSPTPELILGGTRLFSVATRILINAMEVSVVRRLICVTGFGVGDSRGHGGLLYNTVSSLLLGRINADKDAQEWIIRRSRLDWTIVRPTVLTTGPRTGAYRVLVDRRDWRSGFISRADVADFLVKTDRRWQPCSQDAGADELTARVRRRTAKLSLGYREGPNAAVEIGTDIMPVELDQTRVSYVVRLL